MCSDKRMRSFTKSCRLVNFVIVLNSRQMGKSSLRVQTMQRLQKQGTVCAAIDLTGIGKVTEEQWYGGIVYNLSESCQLEDKFNFDWQVWWQKHQTILSPVQCLNQFIEKVLLEKIQQPIVIFVDEIDKVLSQDFSLDDFFALIRFFQNQRVDNPIFERLTFALLGVATPGDLITNKTQTPFNIGEAIELHGFKIDEVEPLIKGLQGRFDSPQKVMTEILDWTGGQPFLTQKLCKFMVEESTASLHSKQTAPSVSKSQNSKVDEDYSILVREVVNKRIIENWESQDNPEHLRTIRDRILSSEQRAGYLLELYQQIQQQGEVATNNSIESSELRLSGLVVQRQGKLRVYNRVYQQVFNQNWIETQLNNLRPYSEAFRAWVASGYSDESRLLQGKALEDASEWAKDKNLSYQDKQFLAASKEKEIAVRNQEAELERERKDREAAEKINLELSEANRKAKRRIWNGTVVLLLALLGAVGLGLFATIKGNEAFEAQKTVDEATRIAETAQQQAQREQQKAEEAKQTADKASREAETAKKQAQLAQNTANDAKQQAQTEQQKARLAQEVADEATQNAKAAKQQARLAQNTADEATQNAKAAKQQARLAQNTADEATQKAETAKQQAQREERKAKKAQTKRDEAIRKADNLQKKFTSIGKDIETVQELSKLAGELHNKNLTAKSDEALRQAGLSFRINDHNLKQAMLLASMSQAYQNLKKPYKAKEKMNESLDYLNNKGNNTTSSEGLQIKVLVKALEGKLLVDKSKQRAIKAYQEAFYALKNYPSETNPFKKNQILTTEDIESVHRGLLELHPNRNQEVWNSLKEHFYARLEHFLKSKNWRAADFTTSTLMLFIADREKRLFLNIPQIENFSCTALQRIDKLWVDNSNKHFGFSVQKRIWEDHGLGLGIKPSDWNQNDWDNYLRFANAIGWYKIKKNTVKKEKNQSDSDFVQYDDYIESPSMSGGLPAGGAFMGGAWVRGAGLSILFSRCDL